MNTVAENSNDLQGARKVETDAPTPSCIIPFHCGPEWHLSTLPKSCALIYLLASRLTAKIKDQGPPIKTKLFYASAKTVSGHLHCDSGTIHRGIRALREIGFFETAGTTPHGTNIYRVLTHEEWQEKHPGQCGIFCSKSGTPIGENHAKSNDHLGSTTETMRSIDEQPSRATSESSASKTVKNQSNSMYIRPIEEENVAAENALHVSFIPEKLPEDEVKVLTRELTFISRNELFFTDKQRERLAEVLKEFSSKEIQSAFKAWFQDQDMADPKNVTFLPGQFAQIADDLCYGRRKTNQEHEAAKKARDAAVFRMQADAQARLTESARLEAEALANDPLAELFSS